MPSTDAMVPVVYEALRRQARALLRGGSDSLSPASLVHDVMVKLYRAENGSWKDERHFRAVAAIAMRQLIIDRGRRKNTGKHGAVRVDVSMARFAGQERDLASFLSLSRALSQLEARRPRVSEVVALRLFGGLSSTEVAEHLGLSESTVKRDWRMGQAWVRQALQEGEGTTG